MNLADFGARLWMDISQPRGHVWKLLGGFSLWLGDAQF